MYTYLFTFIHSTRVRCLEDEKRVYSRSEKKKKNNLSFEIWGRISRFNLVFVTTHKEKLKSKYKYTHIYIYIRFMNILQTLIFLFTSNYKNVEGRL